MAYVDSHYMAYVACRYLQSKCVYYFSSRLLSNPQLPKCMTIRKGPRNCGSIGPLKNFNQAAALVVSPKLVNLAYTGQWRSQALKSGWAEIPSGVQGWSPRENLGAKLLEGRYIQTICS